MGLQLSQKKTRTTHTLEKCEGNVGFDFLGFTVRQFRVGKTHTGKDTKQRPLGFKTLIRPSKEAIKRHTQEIGRKLRKMKNAPQESIISELNPSIRGWGNYHRWVVCSEAFSVGENITDRRLVRWGKARHKGRTEKWVSKKYFRSIDGRNVFGTSIKDREGNPKLI
jgi:RNA-directed DNA polymerase